MLVGSPVGGPGGAAPTVAPRVVLGRWVPLRGTRAWPVPQRRVPRRRVGPVAWFGGPIGCCLFLAALLVFAAAARLEAWTHLRCVHVLAGR